MAIFHQNCKGYICVNIIHLMYGPEENSFVFPKVLMFPATMSRETSGLEGKRN